MHHKQTQNLTITAVFAAIFLLQTFVPNIGYIHIFPALPAITTIPLTITIYSIVMGPIPGLLLGGFWGLTSLFRAYTQPSDIVSILLFRNFLIAVIPRAAAGFLPGLIAASCKNKSAKIQKLSYVLAGITTSLTNTILVILLTSLVFMNNAGFLSSHLGSFAPNTPLIWILVTALGFNGLIEAIFTAVITPLIATPLQKVMRRL